jgi:hypothetical protein
VKRRRLQLGSAGLLVAITLAFFLQDVIRRTVVTPLAYLWWLLNLIYATLPQLLLWILLLAGLILVASISLLNWYTGGRKYSEPPKPFLGPVESLAGWITNTGEGNYYKWMIANRLGKLKQEMDLRLGNRGRVPPETLRRYLKAGVEESFVDYPLPRLSFMRKMPTPFDAEVDKAVEFLESELEARIGQRHT